MVPTTAAGSSNAIPPHLLEAWQAPIDFYGKVVDENSNAVPGVSIHCRWSAEPSASGMRTTDTESDAEGLFSLHGKRGRSLNVGFSKAGYYSSRGGQETFLYALGPDIISPDPRNPIVFKLKKKGTPEPLIKIDFPAGIGQISQLRRDGTPFEIDLLKSEKAGNGAGQLKLEMRSDRSERDAKLFDWKCQISVPGGGLVEAPEEFAFQAPH
jgi:hypothetical protein